MAKQYVPDCVGCLKPTSTRNAGAGSFCSVAVGLWLGRVGRYRHSGSPPVRRDDHSTEALALCSLTGWSDIAPIA